MPLTIQQQDKFFTNSPASEAKIVTKRIIYTTAIASLAAAFLGGESFSESSTLAGMSIPTPIVAGVGIGLGTGLGVLLQDTVIQNMFKSQPESIRGAEKVLVEGGLAVAGGLIGLNYISDVSPSLNAALLAGGSYAAGKYTYDNLDASILGMIY